MAHCEVLVGTILTHHPAAKPNLSRVENPAGGEPALAGFCTRFKFSFFCSAVIQNNLLLQSTFTLGMNKRDDTLYFLYATTCT